MVGGGIAACLLALQVASRATREEEPTPSYTYYRSPTYPRSSETASVTTCATALPWDSTFSTGMPR